MKKPDYKWRLLAFLFGAFLMGSLAPVVLGWMGDHMSMRTGIASLGAFYFAGGAFPVVQFDWADQDAGKTPDL